MVNNNLKSTAYIYRNKNRKLILHDFIYEMFYKFELSGNNDINDYAIQLVNKIADRIYIWKLYTKEINSGTLDFFIGLYNYIEQNGGLKNCGRLSDYTYNINSLGSIEELVRNGIIIREEVTIEDKHIVCKNNVNMSDIKKLSILFYNIIRNSKGRLVLPDELYNAYCSFDGDTAYNFAVFAIDKMSDKLENISDELYKYYAAIFNLIEKEKFCTTISDFCKYKKNCSNKEYIKSMIKSQQAKMYNIDIDESGNVKEILSLNINEIDNSPYSTANESKLVDLKEEEHKVYLQTQIIMIESELNKIANMIQINNRNDYAKYINKIKSLKIKAQNIYEFAQHKYELQEIHDSNVTKVVEKKYKEITFNIEKLEETVNKIYFGLDNQQKPKNNENEKIDYYQKIMSELETYKEELNTIIQTMNVNSDKDYMTQHSKLSNLRDRLHNFYDKSLKEAHQNVSLTGHLIKEATTKHNELIKNIEDALANLELLKKKLLFKNIFNG